MNSTKHGCRSCGCAPMTRVEADDRRSIGELAAGPIDCVFDLLPRWRPRRRCAAVLAVCPGVRAVLMGGVGRSGGAGLALLSNIMG